MGHGYLDAVYWRGSRGLDNPVTASVSDPAAFIAVLQLLYTEATAAEWLFSQEKATLHGLKRATSIGEPL
jgi:hypothetical protein